MPIGIADVIRLTARNTFEGEDSQNVFHVQVSVDTGGSDLEWMDDLAVYLETIYASLAPFQNTGFLYGDITGQNLTKDELLPAAFWPTLVAGALGADGLPPQVTGEVFFTTIVPRVIGRKFYGGFVEVDNVNGEVSALLQAALLNAALAQFIPALPTPLVRNVIPIVFNALLSRATVLGVPAVSSVFQTQRRRTVGRGS